jgi:hypothetical protein
MNRTETPRRWLTAIWAQSFHRRASWSAETGGESCISDPRFDRHALRPAAHRPSPTAGKPLGLRRGDGGSPPWRVADLCGHIRQREVLAARSDHCRQRRHPHGDLAVGVAGPGRPGRPCRSRFQLRLRGDAAHGERGALHEHLALASGGDRRRQRSDEMDVRPRRLQASEGRHQPRVGAPGSCLLAGGRGGTAHLVDGRCHHVRTRCPDGWTRREHRRQGAGRSHRRA